MTLVLIPFARNVACAVAATLYPSSPCGPLSMCGEPKCFASSLMYGEMYDVPTSPAMSACEVGGVNLLSETAIRRRLKP